VHEFSESGNNGGFQGSAWAAACRGIDFRCLKTGQIKSLSPGLFLKAPFISGFRIIVT
jgi:hypothetical protein